MKRESIPCTVAMQRLWAFLDGELDSASDEQVRRHMDRCRRCYPCYDFQRAYFRLMQRLATEPEPAGLRSRIFQALRAETE